MAEKTTTTGTVSRNQSALIFVAGMLHNAQELLASADETNPQKFLRDINKIIKLAKIASDCLRALK